MSILSKLLQKRGIEKIDDLDEVEKKTYQEWHRVLSKEKLTIEDIEEFCQNQVNGIELKWKELDWVESREQQIRSITAHTIYKTLLGVIKSPQVEREQLEKYLEDLIKHE